MAQTASSGELEGLLGEIKESRGFDFTGYKRPSLIRRIEKRMQAVGVTGYTDYRDFLEANPDEFAALFDTILINVTSFFRDPEPWRFLAAEIIPRILEERGAGGMIRVWSTGCATGEEAYTAAILLAEQMGEEAFRERVKIYATDADDAALTYGRHARYTEKQMEPVPVELRERYFEAANGGFAFRADLRRTVIFGRHDLVQDPPISRIDLLISRNTLIYFNAELQSKILANFHFALRKGGFLFLGKSEVLVARSSLFKAVDLKRRLFVKAAGGRLNEAVVRRGTVEEEEAGTAVEEFVREAGFEAAPVAQLVIDREGRLVLANLQARMLFGLSQRELGRAFYELEVSFRPVELRSRIEQAHVERHPIVLRDVEWGVPLGEPRFVDVHVVPLASTTGGVVGTGLTFSDVTRSRHLQEALQESKREVETAYEELQSTVEELETTNEELQSTNEELETTNEELQSTNEELETMNEELQSTNEELETINDELQQRTDELNTLNSFLESVLSSLTAGVVVVDRELRVDAWNRLATELWGLREDEVAGQHLMNLDIGLPLEQLARPIREVLGNGNTKELNVAAVNRRGKDVECKVSISPLADGPNGPRGAILVMEASASGD